MKFLRLTAAPAHPQHKKHSPVPHSTGLLPGQPAASAILRIAQGARSRLSSASTFEKVIVANSIIILLDTAAGWEITQHNPEAYHYVIDTSFIALAALVGMVINFLLLRAAFAPLQAALTTIRAVEQGDLEARIEATPSDTDAQTLAAAFNGMLDRLAVARDETAGRVLRAQEAERRRVALELHDQTGQQLTALALHAQAIAQRLAHEPGDAATQARQQAERLAQLAEQALAEVQSLSRQLRPALLDDLGLAAALRWLAADAYDRLRLKVTIIIPDDTLERLPETIETALFRIAQESLTNAARHGKARRARITLRQLADPTRIALTVADDGAGFASERRARQERSSGTHGGSGLDGMRERARLAGGSLRIRSTPQHGCAVRAIIPFSPFSVTDECN